MSAEVPRHPAYRRAAGRAADPDGDSVITEILLLTEQFGWPVFPCGAHKRPLTENGFKDATRDLEQIKAWSVEHPGCLWGVPTGAASGLFVLDIDVDPAKGIDGAEALDTIVAQIGPLPATGEAITPRGGRHIYFLQSREGVTSCSAGKLGPGLDTRGDGGYVIVPPSRANGRAYEWEASSEPGEVPFAPIPAALLALLTETRSNGHNAHAGIPPDRIPHGRRNATLTGLARKASPRWTRRRCHRSRAASRKREPLQSALTCR